MPSSRSWLPLVVFLLLTYAVAALAGLATSSSVGEWYPELAKPPWTPPSGLFTPVWMVLYGLMAAVGARIWQRRRASPGWRHLPGLWVCQLVLNALWSPSFFGLRSPLAGLLVIVPLWWVLVVILVRLLRADRIGAILWLPYVAWVSFALTLNAAIWRLN